MLLTLKIKIVLEVVWTNKQNPDQLSFLVLYIYIILNSSIWSESQKPFQTSFQIVSLEEIQKIQNRYHTLHCTLI